MGFKIREIETERKFCEELGLEALTTVVPMSELEGVLNQMQLREQRHRKVTLLATLLLVIALHLYSRLSVGGVFKRLGRGLRFIWPDPDWPMPRESALSYRRYQLGARPVVALFHRVCRPVATPATPGAFAFGLRLKALDGTVENVPDTPENVRAFGRSRNAQSASAFPQVRGVYLVECGTHAMLDAGFWPYRTSEEVGGWRLLRSVGAGDLLLWDAGLHSFAMLERARGQGAEVIGRLPATVKPEVIRRLEDGSVLAYLRPSEAARRRRGDKLLVRIMTYQITDPQRAGYGEEHRLVTTLLDAQVAPALEVVAVYAERIEIEVVIDEVDTHQRLLDRPLRSLKPVGVIQELYGLLIAHYAIRALMHEAAVAAGLAPTRLSFVGALRIIQDAIPEFQMVAPQMRLALYARLLRDLAAERLPERRPRANPRVVKRQQSKFPRKRPEHYHAPPLAIPFKTVVQII
jgi:transposase IS4-like protein/DDE family transposase